MGGFRLGLGPRRVERDVDAELAFHIDMRVRRLVERGMEPAAARAEALRQFGDWNGVRAELVAMDTQREKTVRRANFFAELWQDTVYAGRALRHNLGFAFVVVLSLAVGIGANTAIFTLIDALLLRPLPVPAADELVVIGRCRPPQQRLRGLAPRRPLSPIRSTPSVSRNPAAAAAVLPRPAGPGARPHAGVGGERARGSARAAASSAATTSRCSACRR